MPASAWFQMLTTRKCLHLKNAKQWEMVLALATEGLTLNLVDKSLSECQTNVIFAIDFTIYIYIYTYLSPSFYTFYTYLKNRF
jgi:hypothetical protein